MLKHKTANSILMLLPHSRLHDTGTTELTITLESDYDRCCEVALLGSSNDALGYLITANNASKDVHKDRTDL